MAPWRTGLNHYGGWFFFVGEVVTAGDSISVVSESPHFGYFITRGGPLSQGVSRRTEVGRRVRSRFQMGSERALGLRLASCGNQSSRETGVNRIGSSLTAVAVTKINKDLRTGFW